MRRARGRGFRGECFIGLIAMALLGSSCSTQGQTLKLKYRTGSEHGFFVLRALRARRALVLSERVRR